MHWAGLRSLRTLGGFSLVLGFAHVADAQPVPASPATSAATSLPIIDWSALDRTYLARLREQYHLDEVVARADGDYERVLAISQWVRSRWEHNGSNEPKQSDPIAILEEAETGK